MGWDTERLLPVERPLHRSAECKLVRFDCPSEAAEFRRTGPLNNDVLVFCGTPLWFRCDDGPYRFADTGSFVVHRAGTEVARRACTADGDRCEWLGLHPELFDEALDRSRVDPRAISRPEATDTVLETGRFRLLAALHDGAGRFESLSVEEEAVGLFLHALGRLGRSHPGTGSALTRRQRRLVTRARIRLAEGLGEPLSLAELADGLGCSRFHLCRVFRAATGETLHAYRTRCRLRLALDRLVAGRHSLTDLALELGFSSHSHFTAAFRRAYGVPPSRLRHAGGPQPPVSASFRT